MFSYSELANPGTLLFGGTRTLKGNGTEPLSSTSWTYQKKTDPVLVFKISSDEFDRFTGGYSIAMRNDTSTNGSTGSTGGGTTGGGNGTPVPDVVIGNGGGGTSSGNTTSGTADLSIKVSAFGSAASFGEVPVGGNFYIDAKGSNSGTSTVTYNWGYYLSTDPVIDTSDILLQRPAPCSITRAAPPGTFPERPRFPCT